MGLQSSTLLLFLPLGTRQGKYHICITFWKLRSLSHNFHIHVPFSNCSAQTWTGIGLLEKPPAVNRFPAVESQLGVRASYATRRKRRYEANKCG
jgi:hypothetical protein